MEKNRNTQITKDTVELDIYIALHACGHVSIFICVEGDEYLEP